jgi:hypothetical protein
LRASRAFIRRHAQDQTTFPNRRQWHIIKQPMIDLPSSRFLFFDFLFVCSLHVRMVSFVTKLILESYP